MSNPINSPTVPSLLQTTASYIITKNINFNCEEDQKGEEKQYSSCMATTWHRLCEESSKQPALNRIIKDVEKEFFKKCKLDGRLEIEIDNIRKERHLISEKNSGFTIKESSIEWEAKEMLIQKNVDTLFRKLTEHLDIFYIRPPYNEPSNDGNDNLYNVENQNEDYNNEYFVNNESNQEEDEHQFAYNVDNQNEAYDDVNFFTDENDQEDRYIPYNEIIQNESSNDIIQQDESNDLHIPCVNNIKNEFNNYDLMPVDFSYYNYHLQQWEDHALEQTWLYIYDQLVLTAEDWNTPIKISQVSRAQDIRAWITNPDNAGLLETISELNLTNCGIKVIPCEIIKFLPKLFILTLDKNDIIYIPEEIKNCKIQYIYISENRITTIPKETNESKTYSINLANNRIKHIPKKLSRSQSLRVLNLDNNQITKIPEYFCGSQLSELSIKNNRITDLSETFAIYPMVGPGELFLDGNELTETALKICYTREQGREGALQTYCNSIQADK